MGEPIRVLHVDDEPDFAELTARSLELEHDRLVVEYTTDAEAALDRIGDGIDCVVSDYEMPAMSGIELLEAVREDHPEFPFILFTGKGSEEVASEAISAGVTDYLQKESSPSQFTVLANRIENAVARHRAQNRLATERDQYRRLFERAPVMYVVTDDRDGTPVVEDCNRAFLDRLGHDRETVLGEPLATFYTEESARKLLEQGGYERALAGEFVTEERSFRTADGEAIETRLRAVPRVDEEGTAEGTLTLYTDVTERKERERELERYETMVNRSQDLIYAADDEGYLTAVNEAASEFAGIPREELVGSHASRVVTDDSYERTERVIAELLAGDDESAVYELTVETADGEEIPCENSITALTDDGGYRGNVGVVRDVSDRDRQVRLERQTERLSSVTSVLNHDLWTPLSVASGRLDLARREFESDHLAAVAEAHDRIEAMLEDVVRYVRHGEPVEVTEPVDLEGATTRAWDGIEAPGATLRTDAHGEVRADPDRLECLLAELLDNAVVHGPDDATVTVATLDDGFAVADDGPGVPADERADVFEAGYTTVEEGTGFGLTVAREIATAHGWEIELAESEAGGARVEVTGVGFVG